MEGWPAPENTLEAWLASPLPWIIFAAIAYLYLGATLMVLAHKTSTPNAWMAWVPPLNLLLMCAVGRRSYVWLVLLLIPCVNLIAIPYIWGGIAQARGRSAAWGLLVFVPLLNLLLPLLLAIGPATPAYGAPYPPGMPVTAGAGPQAAAACPKCRGPLAPGDSFCGRCGAAIPAPAPGTTVNVMVAGAPPPPPPSKAGAIGCALTLLVLGGGFFLMLGLCGVGGYFLLQPGLYSPPQRVQPVIPPGIAGTVSVLPRDPGGVTSQVIPTTFTSQTFGNGPGGGAVRIPPRQLPPGIDQTFLPQIATGASSAVYQTPPASPGQSPGPAVNVQVISTPGNPGAARQITDRVTQAIGDTGSPVSVQNPFGGTFQGSQIEGQGSTIYVLTPQSGEIVICIYTSDPAGAEIAGRLAGALGNGQGVDDPQFKPFLGVLPAVPPPDLTMWQIQGISKTQITKATTPKTGNAQTDQQLQQFITQFQALIPQQITLANYFDTQSQEWGVLVCDYGSAAAARRTWLMLRWTFGFAAKGKIKVGKRPGLYFDDGTDRLVIFSSGPYLVILRGPSAAALDRFETFGGCLQL